MKRVLAILFIIGITFSVFSACSKKKASVSEDEEDLDFCGGTIVIARGSYTWRFTLASGGEATGERELKRFDDTEEEFNCVLEFRENINPSTLFLTAALSGGLQVDFLFTGNDQIYQTYLINTLLPIEAVIDDPESDKWRSPASKAIGLYGGKMYGFFPNYWESSPSVGGIINVNMDLLEEYNIGDPFELIEAGEWDWEHFRTFLEQVTFTDGDRQWFGMASGYNGHVACYFPFVLANGGSFLKEENGIYSLNINSTEAMEAYDYVAELTSKGLITDVPVDDPEYLNGGKWMVTSGGPETSTKYMINQVRYPYGPHGDKDTISTISLGFNLFAFPIFSAYNEDEIGEVAEYMFEPLGNVYENGWKDTLLQNVFYHEEECEFYIDGIEKAEYIDMDIFRDSYLLLDDALKSIANGSQYPSFAIDSIFDVINEDIDAKYNS